MIFSGLPTTISRCFTFCCLIVACNHKPAIEKNAPKKVEIRKENGVYRLYKNGQPFVVKGGAGFTHMQELAACGGNTIRTWDTIHLAQILDEARRNNLSVIAGLDIPVSLLLEKFYKDQQKVEQLIAAYRSVIQRFRHHPALLAWCLGNEVDFPYRLRYAPFYKAFNQLIKMIHTEDPGHPVTTTINNFQKKCIFNIKMKVSGLDFISINTFNKLKTLGRELDNFAWFWDGPYMLTEWSPEGAWEAEKTTKWQAPIENTSTKRAELFAAFYRSYLPVNDPRFLGAMAFYWGSKEEFTHTWFSIFNEQGSPTEAMEVLRDCWNDTITRHQAVKIKYMLVDGKGAAENILLAPGSNHHASILLPSNQSSEGLRFQWEIIQEDWWGDKSPYRKKTAPETGSITDSTVQHIAFKSPAKEGPYRIFVTVYNAKGFCATANTPFYVVE